MCDSPDSNKFNIVDTLIPNREGDAAFPKVHR